VDKIRQHQQQETDRQILHYVRGMQSVAPVTLDSVHNYLTHAARITIGRSDAQDRLTYLAKAGYVEKLTEWDGGEVVRFEITADGMDVLDGAIPPRNWGKGN